MELKTEWLDIPANRRILVASDIHGRADWLRRLLEEAEFSDNDELILLGDLMEKGPDSLGCLRYCRELAQQKNVHIVLGNCDTAFEDVLTDKDCHTLAYMQRQRRSILHEMCEKLGLSVTLDSDYPTIRLQLREAFGDELRWLLELPQRIDSENFTFIHAGFNLEDPEDPNPWKLLKNDYFYDQCVARDLHFSKYLIVGHTPTANYCHEIGNCAPIIDRERRMVNIDGGTIRSGGQLNLLIIPNRDSKNFSFLSTDDCPLVTVKEEQEASENPVYLAWWDTFELEYGEDGNPVLQDEFLVLHFQGQKLLVPKEELCIYSDGEMHVGEATNYLLPVKPGDQVKLVQSYSSRSYCKKDHLCGWIANEKLDLSFRERLC